MRHKINHEGNHGQNHARVEEGHCPRRNQGQGGNQAAKRFEIVPAKQQSVGRAGFRQGEKRDAKCDDVVHREVEDVQRSRYLTD